MSELLKCNYCNTLFPAGVKHGCTLSSMRPDLRQEVGRLIATRELAAVEAFAERVKFSVHRGGVFISSHDTVAAVELIDAELAALKEVKK